MLSSAQVGWLVCKVARVYLPHRVQDVSQGRNRVKSFSLRDLIVLRFYYSSSQSRIEEPRWCGLLEVQVKKDRWAWVQDRGDG